MCPLLAVGARPLVLEVLIDALDVEDVPAGQRRQILAHLAQANAAVGDLVQVVVGADIALHPLSKNCMGGNII